MGGRTSCPCPRPPAWSRVHSSLLALARPGGWALQGLRHLPLVGHLCRAPGCSEGWLSGAAHRTLITP